MRVVIQIVKDAKLEIEQKVYSAIEYGMLLLVSFTLSDTQEVARKMAEKIALMRIFPDENGKTNLNINQVNGAVLSVSQFTLYGEFNSRRPSFTKVLSGKESSALYDYFNDELRQFVSVETGVFGADMNIKFTNVGPVTYVVESE
ncbi:MAG: D-tyrosyl-tRNA(Tyr) deacylase [Tenericutes bacterium ADurb.Bin087]|nr:MAG: D-tyrosyl-tRNA(Tyr) deacylase [Tenericutes bacterium ADurb.Bin087]